MDVPAGFEPLTKLRTSPFLDHVGPFFFQWREKRLVLGLRIEGKHANARGTAHGGLILTMADVGLGYQMAMSHDPPVRATTVSMSADFIGSAGIGDWLEADVEMKSARRAPGVRQRLSQGRRQAGRAGQRRVPAGRRARAAGGRRVAAA